MKEYIAFDSHKHYTLVEHEEVATGRVRQYRIEDEPGAIRRTLASSQGLPSFGIQELHQVASRLILGTDRLDERSEFRLFADS